MVPSSDRFKFVDDLTVLEIVNVLTIGITSYKFKNHVPSDIPTNNLYIPPQNLKSHQHLKDIEQWTDNQKMKLNTQKTKNMIFNCTNNYQFTTRLALSGENIERLQNTKLLGTFITEDLKWDLNTKEIIKKSKHEHGNS